MKRKMLTKLLEWKHNKRNRKPLILHGARQTGKTYLLNEFGRSYYKNSVYVNFEFNAEIKEFIEKTLDPQKIIQNLEASFNTEIMPEETLIFFDEIQACEQALTSLKYFAEQAPQYHVVCAGSLLGVAINRKNYSFPVGKVDFLTLYPMDFEEFLWANNKSILSQRITNAFLTNEPLNLGLHAEALELFQKYLLIGGMPAVIKEFVETQKLIFVSNEQGRILDSYLADAAKYSSSSENVRIIASFNSIPTQLAKENKKFQYKIIKKGASATLFGTSIHWLTAAGIVYQCYRVENIDVSLALNHDLSCFKLYMCDCGLLLNKANISQHVMLSMLGTGNYALGGIVENYVAQALKTNGHGLFYWTSKHISELDFMIQEENGDIIPIEVKSGIRVKSRSLSIYIDKYNPKYSIRISSKNFGFENGIKSVPLYAAYCI